MSRIRSKNTRLDKTMRVILRKARIPFKMYPKIFGKPDFLVGEKVVIFCDSSFWHGRNWNKLRPQLQKGSNASYWVKHIAGNIARDKTVTCVLKRSGYKVLRFWDTDVYARPQTCLRKLKLILGGI
jgi:DNA mismatch endonuclease (patch repair protein)